MGYSRGYYKVTRGEVEGYSQGYARGSSKRYPRGTQGVVNGVLCGTQRNLKVRKGAERRKAAVSTPARTFWGYPVSTPEYTP